jgi:predicted CopG family antitoxin
MLRRLMPNQIINDYIERKKGDIQVFAGKKSRRRKSDTRL